MSSRNKAKAHSAFFMMLSVLALSFVVSAAPMYAQVAGATLSGTVTDPTGAVIPNAEISIQNTATGVARAVTTDTSGFYSAPNLLPGSYKVTATAKGFTTIAESGITLRVGAQQTLNMSMKIGQTSQTVTVAGAEPTVQLANSTLSAQVTGTTVRQLPLNGRDWTQLATLQPGVNAVVTQSSTNSATANRANRGFGNQLADSGHSPYENNYRVDGISVNDYSNGSPGSVIGENLGVDAIGQFSVLTTNYSAAYGRSSGAVINAITKSGANQIHGDAYEFLRNSSLDAANFFDNFGNVQKPPFRRNQFGASIGGPIQKDKTFYFGDYEGVRQALGVTFTDNVPTAAARQGILSTGNVAVSPIVQPYLPFWPLPNHPVPPGSDTGSFSVATNQILSENFFQTRIDHTFSENDTLSGTGLFDRGPQTQPDALNNVLTELVSSRQMYGLEETHVFSPALVNTARLGYSRSHGINGGIVRAINPIASNSALGVRPGLNAPIMGVPGLTPTNSVGSATQNFLVQNSFQFYDDAFLTKGSHSLKFGFAVERIQFNVLSKSRANGSFRFGSLGQFLQDIPTSVIGLGAGAGHEEGTRQTLFGFYAEDDWHAKPNLTLNLGLRYEPVTLPTEAHNQYQVLFNLPDPTLTPVNKLWSHNQSLLDFEPRLGFAWDPFRTGKTSVRGGFGIFDILPLPYLYTQSMAAGFPFEEQFVASSLVAGDFPVVKSTQLGPSSFGIQQVPQNPPVPYTMNWNFNIQRAITSNLSLTIGYVGSRTVHRPDMFDDTNFTLPTLTPAGYMWPVSGGAQLNPNFGSISAQRWAGDGWYNGLQAGVTKRLSHGFQIQGSYSWGQCLDTGSNYSFNDQFQNSMTDYMYFDHRLIKGLCDYNITQNGVINAIWTIPAPAGLSGIASKIVGGWQLGGIVTAQTGSPFTPVVAGDPLGRNAGDTEVDYVDRLPGCNTKNGSVASYVNLNCFSPPTAAASFASQCSPFTGASVPAPAGQVYCSNLLGSLGRNQIVGPGLFDLDFSIFKNIPVQRISENFNVQFRAEFFNVLNHANFLVPVDNESFFNQDGSVVPGASAIDATSTSAREIQLGLKIVW